MAKLKSERHHWWPECVSAHWADADGGVNWLLPTGAVRRSKPENFGVIGNGHHVKLSHVAGEASPWDVSFESEFQRADNAFPRLIGWLDRLRHSTIDSLTGQAQQIARIEITDEDFSDLIECVVSLAVRSPMHRENAARAAEYYRGPIGKTERNGLIGLNIRHSHRNAVKALGGRGKAMIVYSPKREFIFGDGFFHNIYAPVERLYNARIFVPITPNIAVLYALPMSYVAEPRLLARVASEEETDRLNFSIHVYARDAIFYRSQKPKMTGEFAAAQHLRFSNSDNVVDRLIESMPGVLRRSRRI